uniref:NHL protein n=1 Tax=virus sp. ct5rm7 TaxID=2827298 RepID=A0A8S5RGG9_9VIRU|nr:MAG TPA: NHL protein [virus sp. ct5rm7]
MKIYTYILIALIGILTAQCSKEDIEDPNQDQPVVDNYNSYWYYSYEAALQINAQTLNMEAEEFSPYTVAHLGDTLFVANTGNAGNSLLLFSQKENKLLKTLKSWDFNGKELEFGSQIEAIVPAGERLYVAERQSRIHVFSLPDLVYITCIGNGSWRGPVFQAQALAVKDGLIFARDKNGKVSIYKESEVTPENYQKTDRYRQVAGNGTANNAFAPHHMQVVAEGKILLTDYEGKRIRVLDPGLVNDDLTNNSSIDMDNLTLSLDFKPKTLAVSKERWYATGDNDAINIYDCQLKEWNRKLKSVKGYTFSQPARIYAQNDSVLWVSDIHNIKRTLVKVVIHKGEIRE